MVAAAGALIGVAGFARQDCSDQLPDCKDFGEAVDASGTYWVHEYASLLAFLLLLVSFFVLARGLRRTGHSRLAVVSRTVGVACSTGVALLVVAPPFVVDNYGIMQRVVIAALFGWPGRRGHAGLPNRSFSRPKVIPKQGRRRRCRGRVGEASHPGTSSWIRLTLSGGACSSRARSAGGPGSSGGSSAGRG